MKMSVVCLVAMTAAACLSACGKGADTGTQVTSNHNYATKSGEAYGYEPAQSDDAKKAGKLVGELHMYRFAGVSDGLYRLVGGVADSPAVVACEKPCRFLKISDLGDEAHPRLVPFSPDTLAGAAMDDAENGKLDVSPSAQKDLLTPPQSDTSNGTGA